MVCGVFVSVAKGWFAQRHKDTKILSSEAGILRNTQDCLQLKSLSRASPFVSSCLCANPTFKPPSYSLSQIGPEAAIFPSMDQYVSVTPAEAAQTRDGVIKLHGAEGFEGMRHAGRLAAEILDALVPHSFTIF